MLKIKRIRDTDAGVYTCIARNAYGSLSFDFNIKVKGSLYFILFARHSGLTVFTYLSSLVIKGCVQNKSSHGIVKPPSPYPHFPHSPHSKCFHERYWGIVSQSPIPIFLCCGIGSRALMMLTQWAKSPKKNSLRFVNSALKIMLLKIHSYRLLFRRFCTHGALIKPTEWVGLVL